MSTGRDFLNILENINRCSCYDLESENCKPNDTAECNICLQTFNSEPERIIIGLKCDSQLENIHFIHKDCFEGLCNSQLERIIICPVCRNEINIDNICTIKIDEPLQKKEDIKINKDKKIKDMYINKDKYMYINQGGTRDRYYLKYLKYKQKYFELKQL